MTEQPPSWTGAENDYRGIAQLPPVGSASLAVVIPVFNRADSLVRTLAGLVGQTAHSFETVVVDDGSSEDIAGAVARAALPVDVKVLHQKRDGFGAHRARNMGAAATDADVLLFLDADCIPHAELIKQHLFWHKRASNIVVAGTRAHIDATGIDLESLKSGTAHFPGGSPEDAVTPQDWRHKFYRRNKQLTMGDAAFRAGVSSNLSVRRSAFEDVGGFSTVFQEWGGEDTELTWRLWNSGMFVIPDNRAVIYHQTQDDALGAAGRAEARRRSVALVADLVPHRFYRKVASPFHTVPKVSWLARTETRTETDRLWTELSQASFADTEIILYGPDPAIGHLRSAAGHSSRLTLVDTAEGIGSAAQVLTAHCCVLKIPLPADQSSRVAGL